MTILGVSKEAGLTVEEIKQRVRDFVVENFLFGEADERLLDSSSLLQEGFVDSSGVMEMLLFLDEEFGVEVPAKDLLEENVGSINLIANYIRRRLAK
jgi:acyl carrier protein